jgi:hypothetical protein
MSMHGLLFLMRSLRLGCRGVVFVCSCAPVFRFARPVVPDFVCFDLGEVVIHIDVGGAYICSVSSDSAAVVPIFLCFFLV